MNVTVKKAAMSILTAAMCIFLVVDAKGVGETIRTGISSCLTVIIPSLFAFMILSSFIINTGIYRSLFSPLHRACRHFIRLDIERFSIFMLSLLGGYPVGVKLICNNIAQNKNYSAIDKKALCFCYCTSPAFAVSIVGTQLFSCIEAGLAVYFANMLACVFAAVILTRKEPLPDKVKSGDVRVTLDCFVDAVYSSGKSLYIICMMILCFNIILRIFAITGIEQLLESQLGTVAVTFLKAASEISNITCLPTGLSSLLPFIAAVFSFGGLCILMQTAAISRGKIPLAPFMAARIPIAVLSGALCCVFARFIDFSLLSDSAAAYALTSADNPTGALFLLVMTIILLKILLKNSKKV